MPYKKCRVYSIVGRNNTGNFSLLNRIKRFHNKLKINSYTYKLNNMAEVLTKQETINEIVKEARKLDKLNLQILLTRLRVIKMKKDGVKPSANPAKGVRPPSMEEINLWKHESRDSNADR